MHARMDDDSNKRHTAGRQGRTKHVKDLNCPLGSHPMCQSNLPIRIREAITKSIHVHKHIYCLHRQIDDAEYSLHGVLSHSSMKQNTMPATLFDSRMLLQQQTTEKYLNQKAMAATNSPKSAKNLLSGASRLQKIPQISSKSLSIFTLSDKMLSFARVGNKIAPYKGQKETEVTGCHRWKLTQSSTTGPT